MDFLPFWAGVVGGLLASIKLAELADKMGVVGKVAQMALKKKGGGAGAAGATAGATSAGGAIAGAAEDAAGNAAQNVTQNIGQGSVIDLRPKA